MKKLLLITGIALAIIASATYYIAGYSKIMLGFFLASILITSFYFFKLRTKTKLPFDKYDFFTVLILLLIFTPIYTAFIYTIPWQVNSDEVTIMAVAKNAADNSQDPFGLSGHFGLPRFIFLAFGLLGKMLGGINLLNMRTLHSIMGLTIIALSYFLFRIGASKTFASAGAVILGSSHALLAISRMSMRDNTGLLIEVAALTALLLGFQKKCPFYTFLGGLIAGLSFYTYYPGRITIILWGLFLVINTIFSRISFFELTKFAAIACLGFIMVSNLVILATIKAPENGMKYQREQTLIFPEGRELAKQWYAKDTIAEGVKTSISYGLTAFNNNVEDHGFIYPNKNHGFVDPLTGILIWLGLVIILLKPKLKDLELLTVIGFLLIWLMLAFIVNKSPNYTRLLVILPFIAFLATDAINNICSIGCLKKINAGKILFLLFVCIIFFWNLGIFADFAKKGFAGGNDIGGTARYIEKRKDITNYTFYIAESEQYPYYTWGKTWHEFFVGKDQRSKIVAPENMSIENPPFTIFTSKNAWALFENQTRGSYQQLKIHNIKPDGSLIAVEVT